MGENKDSHEEGPEWKSKIEQDCENLRSKYDKLKRRSELLNEIRTCIAEGQLFKAKILRQEYNKLKNIDHPGQGDAGE